MGDFKNNSTNNTDDEFEIENENTNNLLKLHKFSSEEIDYYKIQVDVMMLNAHHQLKFQRILQSQKYEEEKLKANHQISVDFYNQLSLSSSQINDNNNIEKSNHQILLDTLNIELLDLNYLKQLKKIYLKYTLEIKNFVDNHIIINQINNNSNSININK